MAHDRHRPDEFANIESDNIKPTDDAFAGGIPLDLFWAMVDPEPESLAT